MDDPQQKPGYKNLISGFIDSYLSIDQDKLVQFQQEVGTLEPSDKEKDGYCPTKVPKLSQGSV